MSAILSIIETSEGKIKKASYEAAYYASQTAASLGLESVALVLGQASDADVAGLGQFGVKRALFVNDSRYSSFDSRAVSKAAVEAAGKIHAKAVVLSFNQNGKLLGGRLAIGFGSAYFPGAAALPVMDGSEFTVLKSVYSGKASAIYKSHNGKAVIAVTPNSLSPQKGEGSCAVEAFAPSFGEFKGSIKGVDKVTGTVPLTEAELVVSGGRGLKGPENWHLVEDLAKELGAATACSRPVSDVDWRPHHEHVGQTGITVRPNLYIAVGISGAIQHLAGVNQSKTIVVINSDPEAPFFKAADYGIVGDAFEVMPKLLDSYRKFKAASH
jgi:electron transfer flavoprotein alpha subunit